MASPKLEAASKSVRPEDQARADRVRAKIATTALPTPYELRLLRESLGLSQADMARALGFAASSGPKTVRDWEHGHRDGGPFFPSPTAWAALRYLLMVVEIYRCLPSGAHRSRLAQILPECLR